MGPIVGIGELLWDIYPDGRKVAGGAPFNFAFHCHQLGHEGVIVSRVGDDDLGKELREEVKRLGMSDEFIQTDYERPTGTVQVTMDANGQPIYEIMNNVAWDYLTSTVETDELRQKMSALCFGSLGSRTATSRSAIARFRNYWSQGGDPALIVCDVNIRQGHFDPEVGFLKCDWLKLNEDELYILLTDAGLFPKGAGYFIRNICSNKVVIVTLGARGCWISMQGEELREPSAAPATVIDTVGAGDAFTAAMVCMHLEGRRLRECARFANHYAARVCEHVGATPKISRAEVERVAFG